MTERTRRIPVDPEYAYALGYAIYCFCYLEWEVAWIIERLDPGYIRNNRGKTAGKFARDLGDRIGKATGLEAPLLARLLIFSGRFGALAKRRNALLHANPFTAHDSEQRLRYSGKAGEIDWKLDDIIAVTKNFESASLEANELLHRHLSKS
jgi:hypothetical protein